MRGRFFRKGIVFLVLTLLICLNFCSSTGQKLVKKSEARIISDNFNTLSDDIIYVDDDNAEGPWDGSLENPFKHIYWGINVAKNGDTVFVFNGSYHEYLAINKSINLQGEDRNSTIITGDLEITADNTVIKGFNFKKCTSLSKVFVSYFDSDYNLFEDNIVQNSKIGIQIRNNCHFNEISKNSIYNNRETGILIINTRNNIICNNKIYDNKIGVAFWDESKLNKVQNNLIFNNTRGINLILLIYDKCYNSISGNTIKGNLKGIYIRGKGNSITKNNFENNYHYHANFTFFDESSPNGNNWKNNYWDNWVGFGPYRVVGEFIYYMPWGSRVSEPYIERDWSPAKEPHESSKSIRLKSKDNMQPYPKSECDILQKFLKLFQENNCFLSKTILKSEG